jgi:hypothetical protein
MDAEAQRMRPPRPVPRIANLQARTSEHYRQWVPPVRNEMSTTERRVRYVLSMLAGFLVGYLLGVWVAG